MKQVRSFGKFAAYSAALLTILIFSGVSFGQTAQSVQTSPLRPDFGTASTYAIFTGGGAINNTGLSVLTGDVGQDGAFAFNGFPPGTYTGTLNRNNSASALAKSDLLTAWTTNAAVACDIVLGTGIVNGQSFSPNTYCSGGATTTSGTITFNAQGNPNAIFIVKIGGKLTANSGTHIVLSNKAKAANIYWFVDGAVDVADNSTFTGTIFARGAITFLGTSSLDGRALVAPLGAINIAANNMAVSDSNISAPGDSLVVTHPAQGDTLKRGTVNYLITWIGSGIAPKKAFAYSLDSGATWMVIDTLTTDSLNRKWNVPDTASKRAMIRITDANGLVGLSGVFIINASKVGPGTISIIKPAQGDTLIAKTANYQITWSGTNIAPKKTFDYSLDGGITWTLIGSLSTESFSYQWSVPDTATLLGMIRLTDSNGVVAKSKLFVIKASNVIPGTMMVITPAAGSTITGFTNNYAITWSGSNIASTKTFEYSVDGGLTWFFIGTINSDATSFNWPVVPNIATTQARVRITDANLLSAVSGLFTITTTSGPGSILVEHPISGEVIAGSSQNFQITWTGTGIVAGKTIEYSLDAGQSWNLIGFMNSDEMQFNWANIPNIATTNALVRITDANGLSGTSGFFTITYTPGVGSINSIVLTGLDAKRNIGNNKQLFIGYTFTPEIGPSVEVEYSIDYTTTWGHIATLSTSEAPSTSWMTVPTGFYSPVFIRVTSSMGMTRMSGPFSIGTDAGVANPTQANGFSIASYPNPAVAMSNFVLTLPVAADVTLTMSDALGHQISTILERHVEAGTITVPINTSNLAGGIYNYTMHAGSTTLIGKMVVVK